MNNTNLMGGEEYNKVRALGAQLQSSIYIGLAVLGLLFLLAAFAPLSGGAIAAGIISPEGSRRVVQHLEGGVIQIIHVRDGDTVSAREPLITLSNIRDLSAYNIALGELRTLQITEARLLAERDERDQIQLSFSIGAEDIELIEFRNEQQSLLTETLQLWRSRKELLGERRAQIQSEIQGLQQAISSYNRQSEIISEEISGAQFLLTKELYAKPRFLALQRERVKLDGLAASTSSQIAGLRRQMSELDIELVELEAQRRGDISHKLAGNRAQIKAVRENLTVAEDALSRTVISSPVNGKVVDLQFRTKGGVIRPGERILDIVPMDEKLQIEAQINPTDIDIVQIGQTVNITFSALRASLPQIEGSVLRVSPDAQVDARTGMRFYKAEIEVDIEALRAIRVADKIVPGMPVDVIVKTESRTLLSYVIEPFRETFRRGMRETDNVHTP